MKEAKEAPPENEEGEESEVATEILIPEQEFSIARMDNPNLDIVT